MKAGIIAALISAALFGASTPVAKALLKEIDPGLLAGLLYLGSGVGLGIVTLIRRDFGKSAPLPKGERIWLGAAIACGGVMGPLLLMIGLARTPASTAALLLNAEGVLTALLAWFAFGENFDRRIALGMAAITAGALVLSWQGQAEGGLMGPLAIVGACLCWALDNNFTRKVSLSDPVQIAAIKGLAAGVVNCTLGLVAGAALPNLGPAATAAWVGFFGYGISLVLFVVALRHLGSARAGAYFSAAPFVGAAIAVGGLGDPVTLQLIAAAALMGVGLWLHLTENHEHDHGHEAVEHDHAHRHDLHHDHDHPDPIDGEHSHAHRHTALRHRHAHYPDAHHRHEHG